MPYPSPLAVHYALRLRTQRPRYTSDAAFWADCEKLAADAQRHADAAPVIRDCTRERFAYRAHWLAAVRTEIHGTPCY